MQFYNTMSRKKETFTPVRKGLVGVYACGITAYALSHIGHARSAVAFDILVRLLRYKGYEVTFVRNFTDVDDKIIKRANDEGVSSTEIAETYIKAYHEDMDRLGVIRADIEPRATEHIQEMLNLTERLIADGKAYATPSGDVYFRVRSFPGYGKLSGRTPDDLRSGARVVPGDEKEDPLDFALWKSAKPGEPYWESPWGKGRPGWHIECSAMSEKYIPLPLDIHGGGLDLIFPHHENEIAQTEAALGKPLANIWMHNGFVQVDSEKMSKSLGNFKTIRDILESYLAETLRYFLAGKHYRSPIDFSLDNMDESERSQKRVYECLREVDKALARENWKPGAAPAELVEELKQQDQSFMDALEDDVNTAAAMGHLFNMVRIAGRVLEDKKLRNSEGGRDILKAFRDATAKWDTLLGLFAQNPEGFLASLREIRARRRGLDMNKVAGLLRERQEARAAKDFARSDAARDELAALGVEVRAKDMIHVLNFSYDGITGVSTLTHARQTLGIATASEEHAVNFLHSRASAAGVLKVEAGRLTKEQKDDIYATWDRRMNQNSGSSNITILEANMSYQPITISPKDSQLLESRQFNVVDICRFFSVSPVKAFDLSKSSYSTVEATQLDYLTDTALSVITKIEQEINRKVFLPSERDSVIAEFSTSAILRTDKAAQAAYLKDMFYIGAITPNEVRRENNLSRLDNGDRAFVQVNVQTLDAAVTKPVGAPASDPNTINDKNQE